MIWLLRIMLFGVLKSLCAGPDLVDFGPSIDKTGSRSELYFVTDIYCCNYCHMARRSVDHMPALNGLCLIDLPTDS